MLILALHLQRSTSGRRQSSRNDNINLEIDQLRRELGKQFRLAERKSVHDGDVLPLHIIAEFDLNLQVQALLGSFHVFNVRNKPSHVFFTAPRFGH